MTVADAYLDHLTPADLAIVLELAGREPPDDPAAARAVLRREPALLRAALGSPRAGHLLLRAGADDPDREPIVRASPFLTFAVAVERLTEDLRDATHVAEWVGPRQRLPVLGGDDLREVLADGSRRAFLAVLLDSFTRVHSGSVWSRTSRGWRRQRFSDLDPVRLAAMLDVLPESRHAAVHRRLGDLSLFLAGVFPDHTADRAFRPIDLQRLGRAAGVPGRPSDTLGEALETRGGVGLLDELGARWYLLAARAPDAEGPPRPLLEGVAERFTEARRALNVLADRHLFGRAPSWFPAP